MTTGPPGPSGPLGASGPPDRPGRSGPPDRLPQPGRTPSSPERERVVEALCEHYAQDRLEMSELERRIDGANRAGDLAELYALLADLPTLRSAGSGELNREGDEPGRAVAVPPGTGRVDPARVPERQLEVAVWAGRVRSGSWIPARAIRVVAVMGGVELDFREALLASGEVRIHVASVLGGVEIVVPPGIRVETSGFAFMGGFEEQLEGAGDAPTDAPVLRITGFALLGGVEVVSRLPGESAEQARRRRKRREKDG